MEYWKDITGYEGYYQISTYARVRSLDRTVPHKRGMKKLKGRILGDNWSFGDGVDHPSALLCKNGDSKKMRISWMLVNTFGKLKAYDIMTTMKWDIATICIA